MSTAAVEDDVRPRPASTRKVLPGAALTVLVVRVWAKGFSWPRVGLHRFHAQVSEAWVGVKGFPGLGVGLRVFLAAGGPAQGTGHCRLGACASLRP